MESLARTGPCFLHTCGIQLTCDVQNARIYYDTHPCCCVVYTFFGELNKTPDLVSMWHVDMQLAILVHAPKACMAVNMPHC